MSKFIINGGKGLVGEIAVSGAKNSALKALAASLLLDGTTTVTNVPLIEDIHRLVEIMKDLGVAVRQENTTYTVNSAGLKKSALHPQLHQKLRASIMLVGPILHRLGIVDFPLPGGDVIGKRPIDFFLEAFAKFGVRVEQLSDGYKLTAGKLQGAKIVFPRVSVMGTESVMMFATLVPGTTTILNAAQEPEIFHLAEFLNSCGASIQGAGTSTIVIQGVEKLTAGTFNTLPDRIEAGTFAIMAAATKSSIKITGIIPEHLEVFWYLLGKAEVQFTLGHNFVEILPSEQLSAIPKDLVTHEYPGFPTDLQAPMTVLMTQAMGNSLIHESIYDGRLFYVDALNSMGANILMCDPHRVLVNGPSKLYGKKIASPDIRAGIALVIAALTAVGTSEIDNIYQIDRGYGNIEERLQKLGADIKRTE